MAMLTIETSSRFMNAASSMTTSAAHRRGSAALAPVFASALSPAGSGRISASKLIGSPPWRTTLREVIISYSYCLTFLDTWIMNYAGRGGGGDDGARSRGALGPGVRDRRRAAPAGERVPAGHAAGRVD